MRITPLKDWLPFRERKVPATTIVLHATDGASALSSVAWLRKIGLSYHFIIERDGEVIKSCPISKVAFHAGKSVGPDGSDVNRYSIGIAFANRESKGEAITAAQIKACDKLIQTLVKDSKEIKYLTTHRVISPGRKTDPAMFSNADFRDMAIMANLIAWGLK